MQRIGLTTILLLIALRLAIGWHFFFEGFSKVKSAFVGETVTSRPFSSGGYFREATGPLGPVVRSLTGDPDQEALALLVPLPRSGDAAGDRPQHRVPPGLSKLWWDQFVRPYEKHYGLDEEQRKTLYGKVEQQQARVVAWLEGRDPEGKAAAPTKEVTLTYPSGEVKREMTVPERVQAYRARLDEVKAAQGTNWLFRKDVDGARLRKAKAEAAELRTALLKDLDDYTTTMKKVAETVPTTDQLKRDPLPVVDANRNLAWIDWATRWGLTAMGACLLLGFFTRTNCLLAASFLFTTYLLVPAWPWLPSAGPSEGNYLYINKNAIEMLALLALATTRSGRWFGLDAPLGWLTDRLFGRKPAPAPTSARA